MSLMNQTQTQGINLNLHETISCHVTNQLIIEALKMIGVSGLNDLCAVYHGCISSMKQFKYKHSVALAALQFLISHQQLSVSAQQQKSYFVVCMCTHM